jgi:ecotin
MRTIGLAAFMVFACISVATAADDMKAFPPAEDGMTRHVIRLSKQKDETAFKVELIIGKTTRTDAINHYFFGGALETVNIPGWGYNRYVLRKLGPMAGTLMAVDPAAPQVDRFVSLNGEIILAYNSRLPIVVYVPAGVEVRYRLWRAVPRLLSSPPESPQPRGAA